MPTTGMKKMTSAHAIVLAGCRLSMMTWMMVAAIRIHASETPIIYSNPSTSVAVVNYSLFTYIMTSEPR